MERLSEYLEYIDNTGGSPPTSQFDEDWEPVGPMVRADLVREGLAEEEGGCIKRAPRQE